jgi:transposase-like protein
MARPSKYETEVKDKLTLVQAWARDGLTNEQIAHNLGISHDTLYRYQKEHSEFSDALKRGKEVVDIEVENALLKRAMGYKFDEVTYESKFNPILEKWEQVETKRVTKEVQPDTTAQIFWLKNRKPVEWRDKQDIEHSGHMTSQIDLSGLSIKDLKAYAKTKPSTT